MKGQNGEKSAGAAEDRNGARRGRSPKIVEWQRAQTENWGSRRVETPSSEHWRSVAGDSQSTEETEQWRCRAPTRYQLPGERSAGEAELLSSRALKYPSARADDSGKSRAPWPGV